MAKRLFGVKHFQPKVACNRPFANSRPGPDLRNYPFAPTPEDVARIREQRGEIPGLAVSGDNPG